MGELPEDVGASAPVQRTGAAIAKRLGKFPFWRGQGVLLDFLDRVYMETAGADRGDSCSDKISAEG